jgi:hypothetical protein
MSVKHTYTCDQCGQVKGETDIWFAVREEKTKRSEMPTLKLFAFMDSESTDDDIDLCGEGCVMTRVSMCLQEILEEADKKQKAWKSSQWLKEMQNESKFNDAK